MTAEMKLGRLSLDEKISVAESSTNKNEQLACAKSGDYRIRRALIERNTHLNYKVLFTLSRDDDPKVLTALLKRVGEDNLRKRVLCQMAKVVGKRAANIATKGGDYEQRLLTMLRLVEDK